MAEPAHGSPPLVGEALDVLGLIDLIPEAGLGRLRPGIVAARMGLTVAEFEQRFGTVEGCYLKVFEAVSWNLEAEVVSAYGRGRCWRERMRAAAYAAARWLRDHPREARFVTVQILGAGPMAVAVRERRLEAAVELIDSGRECLDDPAAIGREVAVAVAGAIQGLLVQEFFRGRGTAQAEAFVPQLMYVAVRPYLGRGAALEELSIPPPPEP
jgi:hypothetical protein